MAESLIKQNGWKLILPFLDTGDILYNAGGISQLSQY